MRGYMLPSAYVRLSFPGCSSVKKAFLIRLLLALVCGLLRSGTPFTPLLRPAGRLLLPFLVFSPFAEGPSFGFCCSIWSTQGLRVWGVIGLGSPLGVS